MKGSKFNEIQIISILREVDSGAEMTDICRKYGIGLTTFYKWEAQYGGLGLFKLEKIRLLEGEYRELKRVNSELTIKNEALKSLIEKKFLNHSRLEE